MELRALILMLAAAIPAAAVEPYTFLWWADGWHYRAEHGRSLLHVQTSQYGLAVDAGRPDITRLGRIDAPRTYADAVSQLNDVITSLPESSLDLSITIDGVRYRCVSAANGQEDAAIFPIRLIESGRFLQRFDILNLAFQSSDGMPLDLGARLEFIAWPERWSMILELSSPRDVPEATVDLVLESNGTRVAHSETRAITAETPASFILAWPSAHEELAAPVIDVRDASSGDVLEVRYDPSRAWHYVDLPERSWDIAQEPDRLDRFPIVIDNSQGPAQELRLLFAFDDAFTGVTGMCPILRDRDGRPTGIPVQISKNWHRLKDREFLYQGPWFHGACVLPLEAGERWEGELAIAYARWGGLPSASHAQLCLIGWGTNQLWDQAAIGSWGESICYDPDVNLTRSMIDDIRPLMVTSMRGGQWEWTHNVGGGDFLVYIDAGGTLQRLTRMRTAYLSQGPNLTRVVYAGITHDQAIEARIEVSTPRCDDVNRAYHRIRYDVRKPAVFSRLAFYQLGADRYNDHQFATMARGNAGGLLEEWTVERGGKQYSREGIAMDGDAPWFSLHGGIRGDQREKGAWANRGLVVRRWHARLGGRDVATPFAAVYGTENGVPSANVELAPPPDLTELQPGDFVEAELELLIVPQSAEDYYGPNPRLRADLETHPDSWQTVHRLAASNSLRIEVDQGTLRRSVPIEVAAHEGRAAFAVYGGGSYVPVTITNLPDTTGYRLFVEDAPLDQSVHGNDFWQAEYDASSGTYRMTFNVLLDGSEATRGTRIALTK